MDKGVIIKLVNCKYRSEDDILGKHFLLKEYPEIKNLLVTTNREVKMVSKEVLEEEFGIMLEEKVLLAFTEEDFPELYK